MAAFDYKALTADGRRTSGTILADSARAARRELRTRQLTPVDVKEAPGGRATGTRTGQRLSHKQRTLFTRQMAALLQSGMTVEQALTTAAADSRDPRAASIILRVRSNVVEGAPFADSLRLAPGAFPQMYCAVVAAGEAAGKLPVVLDQLSSTLERNLKMTSAARAALVYPAILGVMAILMVSALMIFVVPKLVEQFAMLGTAELPGLTKMVIGVSEFVRHWGWAVVLATFAGGFIVSQILRKETVRRAFDATLLQLPLAGGLLRTYSAARFARVHATLAGAGATVLEALSGARGAMSNLVFRDAVREIHLRVQQGGSLSESMRSVQVFPPLLVHMVQSGEAARDVPAMMNRAADFLESEFETSSRTLLSLLEPVIIIFLGGVVGTIVLSIMLPIMQLNTLALG